MKPKPTPLRQFLHVVACLATVFLLAAIDVSASHGAAVFAVDHPVASVSLSVLAVYWLLEALNTLDR